MAPTYNKRWLRGDIEDEAILEGLLQLSPGSELSILDVGCGAGRLLATARKLTSGRLAGIDNCDAMLSAARKHIDRDGPDSRSTLFKLDIANLPSLSKSKLSKLNLEGKGYDIIICMHTLSHFRGVEGPILRALHDLLEPTTGRMVFDIERTPIVFSGIDHGIIDHRGGTPTWLAMETFATRKFVEEAISQARQLVQQHMPGSTVKIAKDAARMNERMSGLRAAPYSSMHQSLTIPGQTTSGEKWSWTDAIHVQLANDMDPRGKKVPVGLRLSPVDHEARLTLLPDDKPNDHIAVMKLSRQEHKAIRQARGEVMGGVGDILQNPRSVKAVVVTSRTGGGFEGSSKE
jgi:2-polyprenyl-3-methyl-5-hydroxy-6-metoxy-1,4-benzoquinol methylase